MQHMAETLCEDKDSLNFHQMSMFSDSPTDPPIVPECCLSCTSRLTPFEPVGRLMETRSCQRGWMSGGCLRETSAAYICLISPRGQKWLTQRVPRIPAAGMLRFSDLFFGGSCDNVVHHILTADKQLLKQKDCSILKECRKSLCAGHYNDASRPNEYIDMPSL